MTSGTSAFYDAGVMWLLVGGIAVIAAGVLASLIRPRASVVIGAQIAAAAAAEQRRVARGAAASILPPERYTSADCLLIDPTAVPLDAALRETATRYATADAAERAAMRDTLSMDDLYTLMTFASREAVFARRSGDAAHIDHALAAMAMIATERIDARDAMRPLALLQYCAGRIAAEPARRFETAAALAELRVAELLRHMGARDVTLDEWMLIELPTGFIGRGLADYTPSRDLVSAIVAIADVMRASNIEVGSVSVGEELPPVWLRGAEPLLRGVRGGATIHTPISDTGLMVFLIETRDAASAKALEERSRVPLRRDWAMTAVARGPLFCLVVARAFTEGTLTTESDATLQRFDAPIAAVLERFA